MCIISATDLLTELTDRGVTLWEEGGLLRFRAPSGVLTDEHRSAMRAQKAELLELVRTARPPTARPPAIVPDPDRRYDPFPLTDVQSAYLLGRGAAFDLGGVACHVYMEVAWPDVDPERLHRAWRRLVERHDMLRAVIDPDGAQRVLQDGGVASIPVTDLRDAGPDAVERALAAVRHELDHRIHPTGGPLYDLRATRTPDGAWLHLSCDFLVSDWAGISLLLGELETLHADPTVELAPIGVGFRDYVLAERGLRDTAAYRRDRDYWLARVDDLPPAPELPLAPRDGVTPRFTRHTLRLDPASWDALRRRAGARNLTPSTAVLGAYAAVLERWSRHPRFTLNLTVLNRMPLHPDIETMIGDFTTVSLLAVEPAGTATFAEHAAATGARMFDDLDHRLCSGVEVLREVHRRRGSDAALMPVVFTSAIGVGGDAGRAMAGRIGYGVTQTPQVHIDCQAGDGDAGLQVNWDVRDGVFPPGMVDDMVAAFGGLLTALSASDGPWDAPATTVLDLPTRQRDERRAANATRVATQPSTLHGPVFARARTEPDRPAVITPDTVLGYGELAARARGVAAALRAAGVAPGERVAILLGKGADQIVAVLGTLRAGAVYVPVDPHQPESRRATMLDDAGVRVVLAGPGVDAGDRRVVDVAAVPPAGEDAPGHDDPDAPAYVIFTSGSTGRPKGVVMSHRAAANTVADIDHRFAVAPDDRVLGLAELGFDLSVYDVFGPLWVGGALVLPDPDRRTDPSHWADLMAAHDVTIWDTVPALMQMLVTYLGTEPRALPSLRLAMLSGDWIPVSLPGEVAALLPGAVVAGLGGATEAAIWSNVHVVDQVDPLWPSIPYGRPLANQTYRVLDAASRDCPEWTVGELCIGGAGLADGYLGDPELTAERFVVHPDGQRLYRTGDLGRYRPGAVLEFLGREDTQVKVRGHRIELGEIEAALRSHPGVAAAAVTVAGSGTHRRLVGAVEPARVEGTPADLDRVRRIAANAADATAAGIDAATVARAVADLDRAVLAAMTRTLDTLDASGSTAEQIAGRVHERHRWLVRRWLDVLAGAGLMDTVDRRVRCPAVPPDPSAAFDAVERIWRDDLGTPDFVAYVRTSVERLPALLTGEQDPVELLFPVDGTDVAAALYRDHVMARWLNRAVSAVVHRAAAAHDPDDGVLRVLEVGGGTGATTAHVLEALAGFDVDYLFTDAAGFFLPAARARFGDRIRVAAFDVDAGVRGQGLVPNAFDVVLAAGVLENARDIPAALGRLAELAAPGGRLVLTEPTREHPWILASQAFMMTPPEDGRAHGASYLDADGWRDALAAMGGGPVLCLPDDGHALAPLGLRLFATQVGTDRAAVRGDPLVRHLADRLPEHMVPSQVDVVDALPLTGNGKIDRRVIAGWSRDGTAVEAPAAGGEPRDELETELAGHWAAALGIARIGRSESVLAHGADSLVTARMAGRLRAELPAAGRIPFDTLLRRMLAHPDVASLAEFLRDSGNDSAGLPLGEARAGSNALLTPFSTGDPAATLRVLFHAGLGTMECYRPLAARLVAQDLGPVTGVVIADPGVFGGLPPAETVERLADDYAARLVGTGHTRFQLVGYCLGGMYATEVARRLAERGLEIVDLVLVSSHPVVVDVEDELMIETVFVPNLHIDLSDAGFGPIDADAAVRAFGEIADAHGGRLPAGSLVGIDGELGAFYRRLADRTVEERFAAYARAAGMPAEMVAGMHRTFRQSFLSARFTPEPYAGDIRYLRPTGPFAFAPGMDSATLRFWQEVCLGRFTLTDVGGDHFSCVEPPVVDEVARHVGSVLVRR